MILEEEFNTTDVYLDAQVLQMYTSTTDVYLDAPLQMYLDTPFGYIWFIWIHHLAIYGLSIVGAYNLR